LAMAGNPGRYISIENGPMAESNPNIRMRTKRFEFFKMMRVKGP